MNGLLAKTTKEGALDTVTTLGNKTGEYQSL